MATVALIPVEEYLTTAYRPDCDYLDGVVEERNLGDREHSRLQILIAAALFGQESKWKLQTLTEQRLRVRERRYRIPDVCMVDADVRDRVIEKAPRLCVEVLSDRDTLNSIRERLQDYIDLGVPEVWVFDPRDRHVWVCDHSGMHEFRGDSLVVPGTQMSVVPWKLFAALD